MGYLDSDSFRRACDELDTARGEPRLNPLFRFSKLDFGSVNWDVGLVNWMRKQVTIRLVN